MQCNAVQDNTPPHDTVFCSSDTAIHINFKSSPLPSAALKHVQLVSHTSVTNTDVLHSTANDIAVALARHCNAHSSFELGLIEVCVLCEQVIHMDLKSKNILLNRDQTVAKITDVGLSRGMASSNKGFTPGTLEYSAPEILLGRFCSGKVLLPAFLASKQLRYVWS